jgi:uncharacterized small protein (DUF1192 family)
MTSTSNELNYYGVAELESEKQRLKDELEVIKLQREIASLKRQVQQAKDAEYFIEEMRKRL